MNRLELTTVCRIANTKDESTLVGCIGQPSPLKPFLAENNSLQSSNCNILGLAVTVAFFSNEARFTQIWVFSQACSLPNEVGDPPFFYIPDITNSSTFNGKIFRKKSMLENFRPNVVHKRAVPRSFREPNTRTGALIFSEQGRCCQIIFREQGNS